MNFESRYKALRAAHFVRMADCRRERKEHAKDKQRITALREDKERLKALLDKREEALRNVHKLPRTVRCSSGKLFTWAKEALGGHQ